MSPDPELSSLSISLVSSRCDDRGREERPECGRHDIVRQGENARPVLRWHSTVYPAEPWELM